MVAVLNRARVITLTTGTGTVSLGTAVTGYATLAEAGAVNSTVYPYVIEDGNDFELGNGTYTSSGELLSRDTVVLSKIAGVAGTSKLNLSGSAQVAILPLKADVESFAIAADLASTSNAKGASLVGVEDSGAYFSGTTVEAALAELGADVAATVKLDVAQSWTRPQLADTATLTHNTGWDGTTIQHATVDVNGSSFTIANPSSSTNKVIYMIYISYTTGHSVSWGSNFKGVSAVTPTATAGAKDIFCFRSTGTNLELVGYSLNAGA